MKRTVGLTWVTLSILDFKRFNSQLIPLNSMTVTYMLRCRHLPDLCTVHFVVWFRDVDTSAGGSTEAGGLSHALPTYDPPDTLARLCQKHRSCRPDQPFLCSGCHRKRQNSLFGHVVRLNDHTPANRALSQVAAARTGHRFGPGWRPQPGRPRNSWIQQIGDGTPFSIRAEWSRPKARRRGHSGLTQRTSAVYTI